jgi:excisionase family DNA binding protein
MISEPNTSGPPAGTEYVTKREVAKRLGKSPRTIEHWVNQGILPYIKVERSVLFPWADVQEALRGFYRKGGAR